MTLDRQLQLIRSQPSLLTLQPAPAGVPLNLSLQFWPDNLDVGSDSTVGEPVREIRQSFYQVEPELIFFPNGSFARGSFYAASMTRLYAEFCFLLDDRRHRLVLLWDGSGRFDHAVLIPEVRSGGPAHEGPPLKPCALLGDWVGQQVTITRQSFANDERVTACSITFSELDLHGFHALSNGGFFRAPALIERETGVVVEACWLPFPDRLERLQRVYDHAGSFVMSRQQVLERVVRGV